MEKSRFLFTPETPLGQDVQSLLLQHPEGLRLDEIRRLLRREKGLHVTSENLRELLGNTRAFSLLPGDRYILIGGERPSGKPSSSEKIDHQHVENPWDSPLIVNLPIAQRDYVVFDLETTGTDPAQDRIIQIAALKVSAGKPVAVRNWYVNPEDVTIPYTLKITLGMVDNPVKAGYSSSIPARIWRRISGAPCSAGLQPIKSNYDPPKNAPKPWNVNESKPCWMPARFSTAPPPSSASVGQRRQLIPRTEVENLHPDRF